MVCIQARNAVIYMRAYQSAKIIIFSNFLNCKMCFLKCFRNFVPL